jgi:capsular polysaccharide export protein
VTRPAYCLGFSWRKRRLLQAFLGGVTVRPAPRHLPDGCTLYLWGSTVAPPALGAAVQRVRVEDGFIRSVGLGADLVRPVSWVLDSQGLYYDPRQPSDLEQLLQTAQFDDALLARAAALRARIVAAGISKYNLAAPGDAHWSRPEGAGRVVLVPGQVESDASILAGAPQVRTNLALLQAVRAGAPQAWVVYKPHPDVVARLRRAGEGELGPAVQASCDAQVWQAPMPQLLAEVDEVHTLTSLTGFEALLRGRRVVCYGQPFYAGWGLTEDRAPIARRTRRLTLDELVAGALILYPRYLGLASGQLTTPEAALDELIAWRARAPRTDTPGRRLKRILLRWLVGVK